MEVCSRGLCLTMVLYMMVMIMERGEGQLEVNFYRFSCPDVESIVMEAVSTKFTETIVTAPATLRLFFHDCFIEGCDASILIALANGNAEKDASDNLSLAGDGFDTVMKAKAAVEAVCPGVVSCADILTIAARDVVGLTGGPRFEVELGRRDGLISQASRVAGNLPQPDDDLDQLNALFYKKHLTQIDMIALSGAHTIGFTHCSRFADRLYNFSSSSQVDTSMNSSYAQQLVQECPTDVDPNIVVNLDPTTPDAFDNAYYQNLVEKKGLLSSDAVLFTNPKSRPTVENFARNPSLFDRYFATAMRKLGRVGVKTGPQGEIRTVCTSFNP